MADEEIINKKGAELFRELLRVYSVADLEDYFKAGIWKEELMKADLQLVWAHRREAGAPDPPDLEDVPMPEVPKFAAFPGFGGARPLVPGGLLAAAVRPTAAVVRPALAVGPAKAGVIVPPTTAAANGATSGPAAELKLIALFIAKWKLDPTRTKMLLAKMTPAKRRYIITNFKNATNPAGATAALEQYIAQCEKTNAWGAAVAAAQTAGGVIAPRPATPKPGTPVSVPATVVKRPIATITPVIDPSKRPRITPPGQTVAPPSAKPMAVRPPGQQMGPRAAIRPAAPAAKAQEKPGNLIRSLLQKL
mmetsp:Transcript_78455/g.230066  ORF Transcript_78455/g.230066 Transcript_78455/m.230066 type:complete len:306 (+) Transcript_78455:101-1018(+)